ncbi:hypothetical protein [Nocardia salmonicida]|uniref:hypothetical protein n=1 Tax=Nocardia salmonicida TaxID=53431 RepID=UPI0020D2887C|nr:hypothetical protein [Nocardia salmonicida]
MSNGHAELITDRHGDLESIDHSLAGAILVLDEHLADNEPYAFMETVQDKVDGYAFARQSRGDDREFSEFVRDVASLEHPLRDLERSPGDCSESRRDRRAGRNIIRRYIVDEMDDELIGQRCHIVQCWPPCGIVGWDCHRWYPFPRSSTDSAGEPEISTLRLISASHEDPSLCSS